MKLKKVYIINKEMRMERTNQNTNNDHDDGDEVVPPSGPQITTDIDEVVRLLRTLCMLCYGMELWELCMAAAMATTDNIDADRLSGLGNMRNRKNKCS